MHSSTRQKTIQCIELAVRYPVSFVLANWYPGVIPRDLPVIPPLQLKIKNKFVPKHNKKLNYVENFTLKTLAGVGGSQIPQNILDIMVPIYSALPQKILVC